MPAVKGQKYNIEPKPRIKKVFDKVVEKGIAVSKAMVEEGYSVETAKAPTKLTKTKSWLQLLEKHLPDDLLAQKHKELLNQKELAYFVFSRDKKDDEIESHMEANGLDLIVIRQTDKGKMAFYSIDNAVATKNALEMAYRLKNKFPKELPENPLDGDLKVLLVQINNVINNTKS